MTSGHALYLVHTPYQMLLSYAIAAERTEPAHLFTVPVHSEQTQPLLELLTGDGTFVDHQLLEHPDGATEDDVSNWQRKRLIGQNVRTIRSFLTQTDVDAVFSALDDREVVQAAMHFANEYGSAAESIHIEDGGNEYSEYVNNWSPYRSDFWNKVVTYVRYGFVWEEVTVYGTADSISTVYATFPELLRPELAAKETTRIDPTGLHELGNTAALESYFREMGFGDTDRRGVDVVFAVPFLYKGESERETELLERVVKTIESTGRTVGLKFHPRLADEHKTSLSSTDTIEIPQQIPIELVLVSADTTLDLVIGSRTTALKSVRWLSDTIPAVSIYPLLSDPDIRDDDLLVPKLAANFEKMGVKIVADEEEIADPAALFEGHSSDG